MINTKKTIRWISSLVLFVWILGACQTSPTAELSASPSAETAEPSPAGFTPSPTTAPIPTSTATLPPAAGDSQINPKDGAQMRFIPAGEFVMGSDSDGRPESPSHTVAVSDYWIYQTEVTNAQFGAFVEASGYQTDAQKAGFSHLLVDGALMRVEGVDWQHPFGPESDLDGLAGHPAIHLSWGDAAAYCAWTGGRLPTEAEWEKAARGTEGLRYPWEGFSYPWGNTFDVEATNFCESGCDAAVYQPGFLSPVGQYPKGASPYGVLDMYGNAAEWVWDLYGQFYYFFSPAENPAGPNAGTLRTLRGWLPLSEEMDEPITYRQRQQPAVMSPISGFRCVQSSLTPKAEIPAEVSASIQVSDFPKVDSGLSSAPRRIDFETLDGTKLMGYYFPSRYENAPVVIMAHGRGSHQTDLCLLAPWLQNRWAEGAPLMPGCEESSYSTVKDLAPWWNPNAFPQLAPEVSFAVFTFDFRPLDESDSDNESPVNWALDAYAAIDTVRHLEGVDPSRIFGFGPDDGADALALAFEYYHKTVGPACLGMFSLQPGDFTGKTYQNMVTEYAQLKPPIASACAAADVADDDEVAACQHATGEFHQSNTIKVLPPDTFEEHPFYLLDPEYDTLDFLLQFLSQFFEQAVNCQGDCPPLAYDIGEAPVLNEMDFLVISYEDDAGVKSCSARPGESIDGPFIVTKLIVQNINVLVYHQDAYDAESSYIDYDTSMYYANYDASYSDWESFFGYDFGDALCFVDAFTGKVLIQFVVGDFVPKAIYVIGPEQYITESTEPLSFSAANLDGPGGGGTECTYRPGSHDFRDSTESIALALNEGLSIAAYTRNESNTQWIDLGLFEDLTDMEPDYQFDVNKGDALCFLNPATGEVIAQMVIGYKVPSLVTIDP